ncbi:MAG: adenylate/guanylate cyclase domain-containing protein [Bacteroidetes bacterium]|nr:MAG: adenylate/guanylate cyclase domain-containing protein [Bacteroidota bacterium]
MLPRPLRYALGRFFGYAHLSADEQAYRTLALTIIGLIAFLDFSFNLAFWLVGHGFAWWTTLGYVVFTGLNLYYFKQGGQFRVFRNIQSVLTVLLPLVSQISHGGFTGGSGVVLVAFLAPMGTMMFGGLRTARIFFFSYLLALLFAGLWEYWAEPEPDNLPDAVHLLFFLFNFSFTAAVAYFLLESFLRNKYALLDMVRDEHQKADKLLLDIFPEETALELKEFGQVQAKRFSQVSVMFTDFAGFSAFARTLSAEDLVEQVDFYFRAFDAIIYRHGLEKIKIIGDSYMCAGGIPVSDEQHATKLVQAALDIRAFVLQHRDDKLHQYGYAFDIRIGIHTGPVVAGVVGSSKMAYDIWGETVNIAARMEQMCEAGQINISEATYSLVKEEFACAYRGRFPAKHVGEIDMFYVGA